jgi:hypothetical protein
MSSAGRDDPCPCGSGKKYKRCCGRRPRDPLEVAAEMHELDRSLVGALLEFAGHDAENEVASALRALPFRDEELADAFAQIAVPFVLHETRFGGKSVVERFLEHSGDRLHWKRRAWLESNLASYFSVWEVQEVEPGRSIRLSDLLTGEERTVTERSGGRGLRPRHALLARVVDHAGLSLLVGSHPRPLDAAYAADVVDDACRALGPPRERIAAQRLRGPFAATLLRLWQEAVARMDARPAPKLKNTDGDSLVWTEDTFAFEPKNRDEVVRTVEALDGVERDDVEEESIVLRLVRAGGALGPDSTTSLGTIEISTRSLKLVTNSERRADALRAMVTTACGHLLHLEDRSRRDMQDLAASASGRKLMERPLADITPEAAQMVREFKERHYATWPDTAVPALDGLTPRAAAKAGPAMRRRLDVLLKEFESSESAQAPESRYDVGQLRQALGL